LGPVSVARSGEPRKKIPARSGAAESETDSCGFVSRREAAIYIASTLKNMQQLALQQELTFLSYLIGLALKEATIEKAKQK
jgi:hypothetical protein